MKHTNLNDLFQNHSSLQPSITSGMGMQTNGEELLPETPQSLRLLLYIRFLFEMPAKLFSEHSWVQTTPVRITRAAALLHVMAIVLALASKRHFYDLLGLLGW